MSYAGQINIGLTADEARIPDPNKFVEILEEKINAEIWIIWIICNENNIYVMNRFKNKNLLNY